MAVLIEVAAAGHEDRLAIGGGCPAAAKRPSVAVDGLVELEEHEEERCG